MHTATPTHTHTCSTAKNLLYIQICVWKHKVKYHYICFKKNQMNLAYEKEQMRLGVNVNGLNQPNIKKEPLFWY